MQQIDYIPEGFGMFELSNGKKYVARLNGCMFCGHCTDIFYDYSNGIYALVCELSKDLEIGMAGNCIDFCIESKEEEND